MHPAHELAPITDADLVTVTGGFMQFLQAGLGMANQMVGQFGDDKAKAIMGQVSNIVPQIAGMFGGGGGGAG